MTSMEVSEKKLKIMDLLFEVGDEYEIGQYFDVDSDKMLDEKIEVLTALKNSKKIADIPNYYKVLELMPKKDMWD